MKKDPLLQMSKMLCYRWKKKCSVAGEKGATLQMKEVLRCRWKKCYVADEITISELMKKIWIHLLHNNSFFIFIFSLIASEQTTDRRTDEQTDRQTDRQIKWNEKSNEKSNEKCVAPN